MRPLASSPRLDVDLGRTTDFAAPLASLLAARGAERAWRRARARRGTSDHREQPSGATASGIVSIGGGDYDTAGEPPSSCYARRMHGTVVVETVESRALAANTLGDPAVRRVAVWLPPSYARAVTRRYPVIYWLAGYTGTGEMLFQGRPWQPGPGRAPRSPRRRRRHGRGHRRRARRLHAPRRRPVPRLAVRGGHETHLVRELVPADRRALPHARDARRRAPSAASRRAASARSCSRCATPTLFSAVASHAGDATSSCRSSPTSRAPSRTLRRHGGVEGFLAHFASTPSRSAPTTSRRS